MTKQTEQAQTPLTPGRLVSLARIMDEIEAGSLAKVARLIGWISSFGVNDTVTDRSSTLSANDALELAEPAEEFITVADVLGLRLTGNTLVKISTLLRGEQPRYDRYLFLMTELDGRLTEELEGKYLLTIEPEKAKFYQTAENEHYADRVFFQFPSIYADVEEASRCFALGRPTASVFHSMRVLEAGLYALGKDLGIEDIEVNWEEAIRKVESAISRFGSHGPGRAASAEERDEWKSKREFYAEAALQFRYLKDAWRNRTSHAGVMHQDDKARSIFEHVGEFMEHLATRIEEPLEEFRA